MIPAMMRPDREFSGIFSFRAGYLLLAAVLLLLLFSHDRMPMVDLPGHVSQIGTWLHYGDPAFGFQDEFEFNWFTPYIFGYGLVFLVAQLVSIQVAFKILLALAALSMPLVVRWTLGRAGGEPYWALFALPIFFGHAFHWGFWNYLIALPIGLVAIELSRRLADEPSFRRALRLLLVLALLFFAHGMVFAWVWIVGLAVCVMPPWSSLRHRVWPFLAVAFIPAFYSSVKGDAIPTETIWGWSAGRIHELLAAPFRPYDPHAVAIGLLLLVLMLVLCRGLRRPSREHIPFALFLAAYFLAPMRVLNTDFVFHRLDVFVSVAFLPILPMPRTRIRRRAVRALVLVSCLMFFSLLNVRFREYNQLVSGFDEVAQAIPMNVRVKLVDPTASDIIIPHHLLHQELIASRGAVVTSPWARYWQMPLRIRESYRRAEEADFILARDPTRSCAADFVADASSGTPVRRIQAGDWCLFELLDAGEIEAGEHVNGVQRPAADLVEDAADVLSEHTD